MAKSAEKTAEEKAAAKARRAERRAEKQRAEDSEAHEEFERRQQQLAVAAAAVERLEKELSEVHRRQGDRSALHDHAIGFYGEVDKLAKGKSMMEVTDRIVEEANAVIHDAKALVKSDPFLDRLKEFVSAGNNPVYPDVVVSMKSVLQALGRAEAAFATLEEAIDSLHGEALAIHGALHLFVVQETYASKHDVKQLLEVDDVDDSWFLKTNAGTHFDYDRVDKINLDTHLSFKEESA